MGKPVPINSGYPAKAGSAPAEVKHLSKRRKRKQRKPLFSEAVWSAFGNIGF